MLEKERSQGTLLEKDRSKVTLLLKESINEKLVT